MQAQCPQCATRIQVDDAKIPDRPFKVRCPKCQAVISLPGRTEQPPQGAPAGGTATARVEAPAAEAPPAAPSLPSEEALARRERLAASHNDALVALTDPAATQLQQALASIGYNAEVVSDVEEAGRLLEQGAYEVAVTQRAAGGQGGPETLAERIQRLPPDARRRVVVILVGSELKSGDGTQAWAAQADLVLHPQDAPRAATLVRAVIAERKRLYQAFEQARRRVEAAS